MDTRVSHAVPSLSAGSISFPKSSSERYALAGSIPGNWQTAMNSVSGVSSRICSPSHEIDRPQKPGAFTPFRVGANEGLARIGAISCGEPFRVKLGLINHRRARLAPRLLLAISNVNDTARNDAIARRILAQLLQRVEVEHDFALAA